MSLSFSRSTLALSLFGLLGCSVAVVDATSAEDTVNECNSNDDCPALVGVCAHGRCEAKQGLLSTLLIQVTAPSTAGDTITGDSLQRLDNLNLSGEQRDIVIEQPARVTGTVGIEPYPVGEGGELCALSFQDEEDPTLPVSAASSGIPVAVSFTPSDRILGVAATTFTAQTKLVAASAGQHAFDVTLPAGDYDIYVQPRAPAEGGCHIPPHLLRRVEVGAGTLVLALPQPATFELSIKLPASAELKSLEGWKVDMVDPLTSRVISTRAALGSPSHVDPSLVEYTTTLSYAPVPLNKSLSELVRLSPPENLDAPTVVLDRSVLELFSEGTGVIDQFVSYPQAVDVEGQVTLPGSALPASATVTLVSTRVDGVGDGVFASYIRTVEVDEDGVFDVRLLPGSYRVYAVPGSSTQMSEPGTATRMAAATEAVWEIASEPALQAGKVIELGPVRHLTGRAFEPGNGEPAVGSTVTAIASPRSTQVDLLAQAARGNLSFAPTAQSGIVNSEGAFDVQAEPGTFDVSVRPPSGSGFAWFVTNKSVPSTPPPSGDGLGEFILPLPVTYRGNVLAPGSQNMTHPVPDALVRAYVYLDDKGQYTGDPTRASSVVQVGETRADELGRFELLIPAHLN